MIPEILFSLILSRDRGARLTFFQKRYDMIEFIIVLPCGKSQTCFHEKPDLFFMKPLKMTHEYAIVSSDETESEVTE